MWMRSTCALELKFSLALDAHGLEQGNSILCDVGVLLVDLLDHLVSSSMTSSDVVALDDVKGLLDGSEVQWMFLVRLLSDELLNVPTLK